MESLARHLTRQSLGLIREFLLLNRRRIHPNPPLSAAEQRRWQELRWRIEELLSARGLGSRPARKALRVPTELKVEYSANSPRAVGGRRPCDSGREALACAHEIAEEGLFIATENAPPAGTSLHLKLIGDDGQTIEVEGAVMWTRRAGERGGPPGIGVEFAQLDAQQREAVACLVELALAAL